MEQAARLDQRPPPGADEVERCSPARLAVLLLAATAVLLASVLGRQDLRLSTQRVVAPAPAFGGLTADADGVSVSPHGVFVVPVVLRDSGGGLTDVTARAYAEPVRLDPAAFPPDEVAPGQSRRFVVMFAPDCPTLRDWGLPFRASVLVRVVRGSDTQQLGIHLDQVPAVASVVRGLCRG